MDVSIFCIRYLLSDTQNPREKFPRIIQRCFFVDERFFLDHKRMNFNVRGLSCMLL